MKFRKIKQLLFVTLSLLQTSTLLSQEIPHNQSFSEDIRSLQIRVNRNPLLLPIISLDGNDILEFFFDQMSHDSRSYGYEVIHCNADWLPSELSTSEYVKGFSTGSIDDYQTSVNTTFLYSNYRVELPNMQTELTLSGNYILRIFDESEPENTLCTFAFAIVENRIEIVGKQCTQTDISLNDGYQQVDFEIRKKGYEIQSPASELKVIVVQNERVDNRVTNLQPTYYANDKLSYINNRKLIFEAGNTYRRFDISNRYEYDQRIEKITFEKEHFQVFLSENYVQDNELWMSDEDVNGRFIINFSNQYDGRVEADYFYVHFVLNAPYVPSKKYYIGGGWNGNRLDEISKMDYDSGSQCYKKTILFKQGAYNYQYWAVSEDTNRVSVKDVEGSHWQTENEYVVYVYHRPFGARYDKLIGVGKIK